MAGRTDFIGLADGPLAAEDVRRAVEGVVPVVGDTGRAAARRKPWRGRSYFP